MIEKCEKVLEKWGPHGGEKGVEAILRAHFSLGERRDKTLVYFKVTKNG